MTSSPVIHVVDDDESARDSLTFLLTNANFGVHTYDSGKAFPMRFPVSNQVA